ncbi:MAG: hypothetical protein DRJ03_28135, partial [Chloroflexi bacterium]
MGRLSLEILSVDPRTARPGDLISVKFRINNDGSEAECALVNVWWRSDKVSGDNKTYVPPDGTTQTIYFEMPDKPEDPTRFSLNVYRGTRSDPPNALACVEYWTYNSAPDDFKVFEVNKEQPGYPDIRVDSITLSKRTIDPGETITITAVVKNYGTATGTENIELRINGQVKAGELVTLDPGESETVRWSWTFYDPGTYTVCADGECDTLTVREPARPDIKVTSVSLSKYLVDPGERFSVYVNLKNFGNASGSKTVEIEVDGSVAYSKTVTLGAGKSMTMEWRTSISAPGSHSICADGKCAYITVREPCDTACEQGQCQQPNLVPCTDRCEQGICQTDCELRIAGQISDARIRELFNLADDQNNNSVRICYNEECDSYTVRLMDPNLPPGNRVVLCGDIEWDVYKLFWYPELYSEGACGQYFRNKFTSDPNYRQRYWDDPYAVRHELRMQFKSSLLQEARDIVNAGGYCNLYCETYKKHCIQPCELEDQVPCDSACEQGQCETADLQPCTMPCQQGYCETSDLQPCTMPCQQGYCETSDLQPCTGDCQQGQCEQPNLVP